MIIKIPTIFRLPSLRGERDLSLGGSSRPNLNSVSSADKGAAKPKKEFKPTIPVRRTKTQEAPLNVDNSKESSSNGRGRGGRRDDNRGRGRGKKWEQVLIFLYCYANNM